MHNFFWKGVEEGKGKGPHLIRYEIVERLITLGGLEIENLRSHNRAMLAKWFGGSPLSPILFDTLLLLASMVLILLGGDRGRLKSTY